MSVLYDDGAPSKIPINGNEQSFILRILLIDNANSSPLMRWGKFALVISSKFLYFSHNVVCQTSNVTCLFLYWVFHCGSLVILFGKICSPLIICSHFLDISVIICCLTMGS